MKMTKRLVALMCIVVLAFSLCGCGSTAKKLYGTWETTFDMSAAMEKELGSDFEGFHADFDLVMLIDFNEDGTYKVYVDEEKTRTTIENYLDAIVEFAVDMTYDQMSEMGMSREDADAAIEQMYGKSLKAYMEEIVDQSVNVDDIISDASSTGVYEAKKDKLYMDETEVKPNVYDLFTVDGETLTINAPTDEAAEGADLIEGMEYPFVFTKVQ